MMARAGTDVTLIDQWPEHVEAIRAKGLRLSGTMGDIVVPVKALHMHELQHVGEPFDAVFVAVGAHLSKRVEIPAMDAGPIVDALSFLRSGAMKAFAIMSKERWPGAPEIPTMDEVGVPGMYISFWNGLWVPKATPKEIIARLNAAVVDTLADPTVRQRLTELGHVIATREEQTPEGLGAFHKAEIEKWWPLIKAANIKPPG